MKQTEIEYRVNVVREEAPKREKYQKQLDELMKLALSGDLLPIEIADISEQLTIARRKYITSKVSPEARRAAGLKGAESRKAQKEAYILKKEVEAKFQISYRSMWDAVFPDKNDPKIIDARAYWSAEIFPMLKAKYPLANEDFIKYF